MSTLSSCPYSDVLQKVSDDNLRIGYKERYYGNAGYISQYIRLYMCVLGNTGANKT